MTKKSESLLCKKCGKYPFKIVPHDCEAAKPAKPETTERRKGWAWNDGGTWKFQQIPPGHSTEFPVQEILPSDPEWRKEW